MRILFVSLFVFFAIALSAQEVDRVTVVKSVTSVQANLVSAYLVHERGIGDRTSLRIEAGARQQFRSVNTGEVTEYYYGIRPQASVGVRHYYNFDKRAAKGLTTDNNSGNFVGLMSTFNPDFFLYRSDDRMTANQNIRTVFQWGIRRQLGKRIDFELALNAGLRYQPNRVRPVRIGWPGLSWRFGYRF